MAVTPRTPALHDERPGRRDGPDPPADHPGSAARIRISAEPLTLLDIAARAGVSRATLYRHFASVTDLLDAVAADLLARARFDRLLAALEDPDPVGRCATSSRPGPGSGPPIPPWSATSSPWPAPSPTRCRSSPSSNTAALAALERLADRLHQAGRLRRGLTRARAVDLLLVITAFPAWDELRTARHRSPQAATATITDLARHAVTADG